MQKCRCEGEAEREFTKVAEVYEVFPYYIKPGKDVGSNEFGDRPVVDGNKIPIRDGYEGIKAYVAEVRFITSDSLKEDMKLKNGNLKRLVWYGPKGDSPCSVSPSGMPSTGYPSWPKDGTEFTEEEVPKGFVPKWWTESDEGAKRSFVVAYRCCEDKEEIVRGAHQSGGNPFGGPWY